MGRMTTGWHGSCCEHSNARCSWAFHLECKPLDLCFVCLNMVSEGPEIVGGAAQRLAATGSCCSSCQTLKRMCCVLGVVCVCKPPATCTCCRCMPVVLSKVQSERDHLMTAAVRFYCQQRCPVLKSGWTCMSHGASSGPYYGLAQGVQILPDSNMLHSVCCVGHAVIACSPETAEVWKPLR